MLKSKAMGLLQQPLQRRLSGMLGAEVTFDKLNVSLLTGTVEALGVTVAGADPATPLLTIRRVRAEISIGAALKKEFVVRSLSIERPVLTVVRDAKGELNLPRRSTAPAKGQATAGAAAPATAATDATGTDADGAWKLEAQKVLVVDGEVHFHDAGGYQVACSPVHLEVKQVGSTIEFTLIGDSLGRRDRPVELGAIRMHGTAADVPKLTDWSGANVRASVDVGETLRGRVDVPALDPLDVKAELGGAVDLATIRDLLPPLEAVERLRSLGVMGRVELNARATYAKADGLRVPELEIRGADLVFPKLRR